MDRILIVGAGAIGAITGSHLIRAGHTVDFIDVERAHVDAVRRNGLRLSGALEATVRPNIMLPDEAEGQYSKILLAVKARHTVDTLPTLARLLMAEGYVVSLQNGLEEYALIEALGEERVIGAYLTFGGYYVEPGHVKYGGRGSFKVGEPDGTRSRRVTALANMLSVQQPVDVTNNIFGYLWAKMALGASYFGTAIADMDVVDVYDDAGRRGILGALCGEVVSVADALGVAVETSDGFDPKAFRPGVTDTAAQDASWDAQRRYWDAIDNGRTGIWRDLAIHKRPTEIDGLMVPIVALAEKHAVPVPRLRKLCDTVHAIERDVKPLGVDALMSLMDD
ncbi:MAG: ketopantoate reductase family protein [Alphaproteobacteria bacterium]|nr:ketopantoate reductase family protein [Alphaproteobacteria bacterium]